MLRLFQRKSEQVAITSPSTELQKFVTPAFAIKHGDRLDVVILGRVLEHENHGLFAKRKITTKHASQNFTDSDM